MSAPTDYDRFESCQYGEHRWTLPHQRTGNFVKCKKCGEWRSLYNVWTADISSQMAEALANKLDMDIMQ